MNVWKCSNKKLLFLSVMVSSIYQYPLLSELSDEESRAVIPDWTFAVLMQGDNNLDPYADQDLSEMAKVGSGPNLTILAQRDRPSDSYTWRYLVKKGSAIPTKVASEMGTNPQRDLTSCADWMKQYPSNNYALVLWGHGAGVVARKRAVLFDDSQGTYLSTKNMGIALQQAITLLGKKIELLGMDACLEGMVEEAYEAAPYVNYLVASQELVPGTGWPYNLLLSSLSKVGVSGRQAAINAVTSYEAAYKNSRESYTLSAIDLSKIESVAKSTTDVVKALTTLYTSRPREVRQLILAARLTMKSFYNSSYVDMISMCDTLSNAFLVLKKTKVLFLSGREEDLGQQARDALAALKKSVTACIIANVRSKDQERATGLSIYFPVGEEVTSEYFESAFTSKTGWGKFLRDVLQVQKREAFEAILEEAAEQESELVLTQD